MSTPLKINARLTQDELETLLRYLDRGYVNDDSELKVLTRARGELQMAAAIANAKHAARVARQNRAG